MSTKRDGQYPGRLSLLSRRDFLKAAGLGMVSLGISPALASCRPTSQGGGIGGSIQYLSWEGYDLQDCMREWQENNDVTMESTYIGDHSEIQAKLATAGSTAFDLVTYYQGYYDLYRDELKIIQPLDRTKIPNFENLYELFRTQKFWVADDGTVWGAPFTWGAEGCNYNADEISAPVSWMDLLEPELEGRIAMVDDSNGAIVVAGRILGYGDLLPNLTPDQLVEVKDFLLRVKAHSRTIAPSFGDLSDLLVSGEVVATFPGWAAVNVWAQERGANIQHTIPEEGGFTFIDAFAIPAVSDNVETVLAWINESLSPEIQACQAAALAAGVVNPDAVPLLDEATAALYDYDQIDQVFAKAPVYELPPRESDQYATYDEWLQMWEEVKAG
jgi:spermidine/putrescine transport system substrate-binding protein